MDKANDGLAGKISIIRQHLDKVLIVASGLTILLGGYYTLDYKSYTNCQVQLLHANRDTTATFAQSLRTLLSQPPRPTEERRQAFERLQVALDRQEAIQQELGDCQ